MEQNTKNPLAPVLEFCITDPEHKKYRLGKLEVRFDKQTPTMLQKMVFMIDGKEFFAPLECSTSQISGMWIFQKPNSLSRLSDSELDLICLLSHDVVQSFVMFPRVQNLLDAVSVQAELYKKLGDKTLDKETRKLVVAEFKKGKSVVIAVQKSRQQLLHNRRLALAKIQQEMTAEKIEKFAKEQSE